MTAAEKRALAVALMKGRAGKNTYTNSGNRKYFFGKPEGAAGYSDCSSACRAAIERAAGIDIGSRTDSQLRGYKKGIIVDLTSGIYPNEANLLPGDCLYFKGNTSHVKDVGHVEMYTGPNECWGHGSGKGPKRHDLRKYCKSRGTARYRYFCAVRWILDDGEPDVPTTLAKDVYVASSSSVVLETKQKQVFVAARGSWNLRKGPGLLYPSYGMVPQGTVLGYVGLSADKNGKWVHVTHGEIACWISAKAVKMVK